MKKIKAISINGHVYNNDHTNLDEEEFWNLFIEFVEEHDMSFAGDTNTIKLKL